MRTIQVASQPSAICDFRRLYDGSACHVSQVLQRVE